MIRKRSTPLPPLKSTSTTMKQLVPFIEKSELTLLRLSNRAGMSRFTIYRWFRGEGHPGVIELESIAALVDAEILVVSKRNASIIRKYVKEGT